MRSPLSFSGISTCDSRFAIADARSRLTPRFANATASLTLHALHTGYAIASLSGISTVPGEGNYDEIDTHSDRFKRLEQLDNPETLVLAKLGEGLPAITPSF